MVAFIESVNADLSSTANEQHETVSKVGPEPQRDVEVSGGHEGWEHCMAGSIEFSRECSLLGGAKYTVATFISIVGLRPQRVQ